MSMRLIDADLAPIFLNETDCEQIMRMPTVDAVPVVRCKDCRYCDYKSNVIGCACFRGGFLRNTRENDFCSYGERRNKK